MILGNLQRYAITVEIEGKASGIKYYIKKSNSYNSYCHRHLILLQLCKQICFLCIEFIFCENACFFESLKFFELFQWVCLCRSGLLNNHLRLSVFFLYASSALSVYFDRFFCFLGVEVAQLFFCACHGNFKVAYRQGNCQSEVKQSVCFLQSCH